MYVCMYVCMYVWRWNDGVKKLVKEKEKVAGLERCVCVYVCMYVCMYVWRWQDDVKKLLKEKYDVHTYIHTCGYLT